MIDSAKEVSEKFVSFEEEIKNAKTLKQVDDCCQQEIYSIMDFINVCDEYPESAQNETCFDYETLIKHCKYEIGFLEAEIRRSLLSLRKFELANEQVKKLRRKK